VPSRRRPVAARVRVVTLGADVEIVDEQCTPKPTASWGR
jgi:hypothetical protein